MKRRKSAMWKTTYREIRQSFGRYAAILAIVALGVGFFVGLMVVTPAMVRNGGRYLNNHDLYDLRLLSTLGFEKESVDAFTGREDVKAVEGAVSSDFLAVDESGKKPGACGADTFGSTESGRIKSGTAAGGGG